MDTYAHIAALEGRLADSEYQVAQLHHEIAELTAAHASLRQLVLRLDQNLAALGEANARSLEAAR